MAERGGRVHFQAYVSIADGHASSGIYLKADVPVLYRKSWFPLGVDCRRGAKNSWFNATPAIYAEWKPALILRNFSYLALNELNTQSSPL